MAKKSCLDGTQSCLDGTTLVLDFRQDAFLEEEEEEEEEDWDLFSPRGTERRCAFPKHLWKKEE